MERNFETVMIEQCSPVLAGLKAANLFRHECRDRQALYATVASWNAQLNGRGIRLLVLKECPIRHWFLIYLYRPARLEAVLGQPEVRQFLQQEGYVLPLQAAGDACQPLLAQLAGRLACDGDFPHEIGVFLGYPLEDVVGFIRNRGQNFTCCGCWKAYGDPDAARRLFAQLNKCTSVYLRLFHSGTPILRLAVAA
ncbi:MAG TPA: DUF3793 family protein [Candidatus Faecalibacterium avium]|nr:DUF3793 family protein [Candidatus Faecalibacterium avium]